MERAVFVYTTYPSIVEAERAGRALGRAAAVRLRQYPARHGFVLLVAGRNRARRRSGDDHQNPRRVSPRRCAPPSKQMHSYTTPAILVLPIESVDPDYHAWIVAETQGEAHDMNKFFVGIICVVIRMRRDGGAGARAELSRSPDQAGRGVSARRPERHDDARGDGGPWRRARPERDSSRMCRAPAAGSGQETSRERRPTATRCWPAAPTTTP